MARSKKPEAEVAEEEEETSYSEGNEDIIELDEDLSDVPDPVNLPKGWYRAEITEVERKNSQRGNDYFAVSLVIPVDEYPSDYDPDNFPDGVKMSYNLLRVPEGKDRRALANIRRFMEILGLSTNVSRIDTNEWVGRDLQVKLDHEKYQGQLNMRIAQNGLKKVD